MSTRYESKEDLVAKMEWEGGVEGAINGYGIHSDDLPEGTPPEIAEAWKRVELVGADIIAIENWLYG